MPQIVGLKFSKSPKVIYYDAEGHEFAINASVVVDTPRGLEIGHVVMMPKQVDESPATSQLKQVVRLASEQDLANNERNILRAKEQLSTVKEMVSRSQLEMIVSGIEFTLDGSKCIISFTAEGRVDFRDLVRELASVLKTRIELRQIGARDECKMLGGVAPCGRACCCSDHIAEFPHVSIKMAKNQNLSLNPAKISGLCGRLMCCLQYENDHYVETNKRCPKIGSIATAQDGTVGVLISINQIKETVKLKVDVKESYEFREFRISDLVPKASNQCGGQCNHKNSTPDAVKLDSVTEPSTLDEELPSDEYEPDILIEE